MDDLTPIPPQTATRRLPPEDIEPSMFVAIVCVVHEFYLPGQFDAAYARRHDPIRIPCVDCADGTPMRVLAVCLPFVQAENPQGILRTIDTRTQILARVSEDYALEAFTRPRTKGSCPICDD